MLLATRIRDFIKNHRTIDRIAFAAALTATLFSSRYLFNKYTDTPSGVSCGKINSISFANGYYEVELAQDGNTKTYYMKNRGRSIDDLILQMEEYIRAQKRVCISFEQPYLFWPVREPYRYAWRIEPVKEKLQTEKKK